jgi:hypothetical protein
MDYYSSAFGGYGDGADGEAWAHGAMDVDEMEDISHEDCWQVITAFFDEKGLVRQQLDSFNQFVSSTIQEIIEEQAKVVMYTTSQHTGADEDRPVRSPLPLVASAALRASAEARRHARGGVRGDASGGVAARVGL